MVTTAAQLDKPRVVTWRDLNTAVGAYLDTRGAEHDLHDLWKMGAPIPQQDPDAPEKRVLLPAQFAAWWRNVARHHNMNDQFTWYGGKVKPQGE